MVCPTRSSLLRKSCENEKNRWTISERKMSPVKMRCRAAQKSARKNELTATRLIRL